MSNRLFLATLMITLTLGHATTSQAQTQSRSESSQLVPVEKQTIENEDRSSKPAPPTKGSAATNAKRSRVASSSNSGGQNSNTNDDQWHFQFTPYFWIAGVTGEAGIGDRIVQVDSALGDENVKLNFGFMSTFEARRNKLLIVTDLQYSNIGTERPNPGILFSSATADFKTFILDPEVGYRVAENAEEGRFVDIMGGIRYWHLRTDMDLAAGVLPAQFITGSRGWVDGVGGVRGGMNLTSKLFMMGKGDLGAGGSDFTYQLFGGFGYKVGEKIAIVGGYRALHVDYNRNNFLFDTTLHGPLIGLRIKVK